MEDLIFCVGCKEWFLAGDTVKVLGECHSSSIDPPEDKDCCKNCGYDLTEDTKSYDSSDVIYLLNKNNIVPED